MGLLAKRFSEVLRIKLPIKPCSWADQHRYLAQANSNEPGRWRTNRTPYLKEILDCLHIESRVKRVVVMKGHQLGFTEGVLMNGLGWIIDESPGATMFVAPSEKDVKKMLNQKIEPMIAYSPRVRAKISSYSRMNERNTAIHKSFDGGFLFLAGSRVPADLSGTSVRNLFLDEVDRFILDTGGEGSPVELAIGRTSAYTRKKILMGSTPGNIHTSVIYKHFNGGDKRYYHVPCPHCGHEQVLSFDRMKWTDDLSEIYISCKKCNGKIEEKHKTKMLENGKWIPTRKSDRYDTRSYHISSIYAPVGFLSWKDFVLEYLKAQSDPHFEKSFTNLYLGEPSTLMMEDTPIPVVLWKIDRDYARGEEPSVPGPVLITAGVDVQSDRIEALVVAYHKRHAWILDHYIFWGDTKQSVSGSPWYDLHELFKQDFFGKKMHMMAIDSGFIDYKIYDFVRSVGSPPRMKVIKGVYSEDDFAMRGYTYSTTRDRGKKVKTGDKYHQVNTHYLKREIYQRLLITDPKADDYIDFPQGLGREFYEQLCSETMQLASESTIMDRTRPHTYKWVADRTRNEALDMLVYSLGCWYHSGSANQLKEDRDWSEWITNKDQMIF